MKLIQNTLKKSFIVLVIALQTLGFSATSFSRVALADETTAATSEAAVTPAPCPEASGTQAPTGAGSHTFTFIPAPTCLWENTYYSWDAVSKVYTPKYDTRVCDAATEICERINWQYVSSEGRYVETRTVISAKVAAPSVTSSNNALPTSTSTIADNGNGTVAESTGTSSITSGNGSGSDNSVSSDSNTSTNIGMVNNTSVLTTLDSDALSGNALVLGNTTVGNVGTGDAAALANILNMIQSSWNPANGDINLFSADLFNNYTGDLLFDPSIALGNGTDSTNNIGQDSSHDLTVNLADNANIVNNINLNAQSGNADVNGNTAVGDVLTGDATAIANVINMINSTITSGNSFIGSINLHGDLNGDILLPRSLLEILLGNGTGSGNTIAGSQDTDINADFTTNSSITNNTDLTSISGNAVADANTTVGNISTGNADTSVSEMNLVGQNIQGTKGLLVFVNVLGSWFGMLFGNNPGNTSIVGGNGTNSTNNIASNNTTDADINVENNYEIVNNLNLSAASGNATANANTTVGNISTGNASTGANLLNMINSSLNFTDWFGVLFINVFGNWQGSFGLNTQAGNAAASGGNTSGPTANSSSSNAGSASVALASGSPGVFNFVPHNNVTATNNAQSAGNVAAATASGGTNGSTPITGTTANSSDSSIALAGADRRVKASWTWTIAGILTASTLLGLERYLTFRRRTAAL